MKRLRILAVALVAALGLSAAAISPASASGKSFVVNSSKYKRVPVEVAHKLERVHYRAKHLREIRDPYKRDYEIDRLQSRLKKLKKRTLKYRGKQVRRNLYHIDRLQGHLRHLEKKNNKRIRKTRAAERRAYRSDRRYDRRHERRYDRRHDRRSERHRDQWFDARDDRRLYYYDERGRLVAVEERQRRRGAPER